MMKTDLRDSFRLTMLALATLLLAATGSLALSATAAHAACAVPPAGDADCDGLADGADPCPADTLNRCNGPVVSCGTAPPGVQECSAGTPLRIDVGASGPQTDCNGDTWEADLGAGKNCCSSPVVAPATIATAFGCTDAATEIMVGSEKFGATITRSYPVPNGTYIVNLIFAETFLGACVDGWRTVDIDVEGVRHYGGPDAGDGFDQYATSAAQNGATDACGGAVVRSLLVGVADGALDIVLTEDDPDTGDTNASIKGIEVLQLVDGCIDETECDDGDPCTTDTCNELHLCLNTPPGIDADGDNVCDLDDMCPADGCDDADADGYCTGAGFNAPAAGDDDNCPHESNPAQTDTDGDGRGDACDLCPDDAGSAEDGCLGTGIWDTRAPARLARSEGGLVEAGGKFYLIGGEQTEPGKVVEIYDPTTDTWQDGPSLPSKRHHIQPVAVKNKIYVIGGLENFPAPDFADNLMLDTDDMGAGWQAMAPMPTPRGGLGCAADGVRIYCAGGLSSTAGSVAVDTFEVYNTVTDQWQTLTPLPRPKDHFQAQVVDGQFYSISGRDTAINDLYAFNDVYDIATDTWSLGAPIPTPRGGYASVVVEGRIVVIGGEGPGPADGTFPDVEEYDPARDSWRTLADVPTSRHGFGAVVSSAENGVMPILYTVTGGWKKGFSSTTGTEVFYYGDCILDADCDDGNVCTDDVCAAGRCEHAGNTASCDDGDFCNGVDVCLDGACSISAGNPCDDGVACTIDTCDEATDTCGATVDHAACDDGLFCNGTEVCDALADCQAGTAPSCDDGIACTTDTCNAAADACDHATVDAVCDDGVFCNGVEICDAAAGCGAGAAPACSDGIACTTDSCNVTTDACEHAAVDAVCDDGAFCNGTETCDAGSGCLAGSPIDCDDGVACTADSCDEAADACDSSPVDASCEDGIFCNGAEVCDAGLGCQPGAVVDCDDGISCTVDSCNEAADGCDHGADHATCDDGNACNGVETCNALSGCDAGSAPDCDDGNPCTADSCNDASGCSNLAIAAGFSCTDGLFCNGEETCDGAGGCQGGTAPALDDGVGCTTDSCDEASDSIVHSIDDGSCDDGLFCNGVETCDAAADCQAGAPVVCDDAVGCTTDSCDEDADACANAASDAACADHFVCNGVETCDPVLDCQPGTAPDCDDGVDCTFDICGEAVVGCISIPLDTECDDGLFCNGAEICDAELDCQASPAPDCDDAVGCTADACDEDADTCTNVASDLTCDDGLFCNGTETCDAELDCQAGTAPDCDDTVGCTADSCDEDADLCSNVTSDAACDDGVGCTADRCDATADCVNASDDAICDDGVFCNGAELCDVASDCSPGAAPTCDDGVSCTADTCDVAADTCVSVGSDAVCDDGLFCNGVETCDAVLDCQAGTQAACDDGNDCTFDVCNGGANTCAHLVMPLACDDSRHCNGVETCDAELGCLAGEPPACDDGIDCTVDACNEATDGCDSVPADSLCDDGNGCTDDSCSATSGCGHADNTAPCDDGSQCSVDDVCEAGSCAPGAPRDCDDGLFCNGSETCDDAAGCQAGTAPDVDDAVGCTDDACDEDADAITHTPDDTGCDDGAFCNGAETCDAALDCQPGTAPDVDDGVDCTDDACDEDADAITHATDDAACDDGAFCNGVESCDAVAGCQDGQPPVPDEDAVDCTVAECDEAADTFVQRAVDAACDDGTFCNGAESCDTDAGCQDGTPPVVDDGVTCTIDVCDEDVDVVLHTPDASVCDDGAFCNGAELCDAALDCQPASLPCDDGVPCTVDGCDEETAACTNSPADVQCDDGLACNGQETCHVLFGCLTTTQPPSCEDLDSFCAIGECVDGEDGCVATPVNDSEACEDGNACTAGELCAGGQCLGFSLCGVPLTQADEPTVTDSLFVLRAAVALETCDLCECDVDGDMAVLVSDALRVMRRAVGLEAKMECFVPVDTALEAGGSTTTTVTVTSTTMPY